MQKSQRSLAPDKDFKVVWLPGFSKDNYYEEDYKLAEVLATLESIYFQLDRIRGALGLKKLIDYSSKPSYQDVIQILTNAPTNGRGKRRTRGWAEWLAYRYRLSRNWYFPLEVLLLSHVLPVPPDPVIGFYSPPNPGSYKDSILNLVNKSPNADDFLNLPFIYMNYQVSVAQLKQFIEDNKEEIRKILAELPSKPSAGRMTRRKLMVGQIAWILKKHGGDKSWGAVTEDLNNRLEESFEETEIWRMAETFAKQQKKADV